MNEEWAVVPADPRFSVSSFGAITKNGKRIRGASNGLGYRRVKLISGRVLIHRLVAELFLSDPDRSQTEVDHIDGNTENNAADNLRWATRRQNNRNKPARGFWWLKDRNKWQVQIRIGNGLDTGCAAKKTIGYFDSEAEAASAYEAARISHHGEFSCRAR